MSRTASWALVAILAALVAYLAIERFATPRVSAPGPVAPVAGPEPRGPESEPATAQREVRWGEPARQSSTDGDGGQTTDPAGSAVPEREPAPTAAAPTGDEAAAREQARRTAQEVRRQTQQMQGVQRDLLALMQDPRNVEIDALSGILDRVMEIQGTESVGGLDLSRLQQSMDYAREMAEIGRRMNEAVQDGAGEEALQAYAEEFRRVSEQAREAVVPQVPEAGGTEP